MKVLLGALLVEKTQPIQIQNIFSFVYFYA